MMNNNVLQHIKQFQFFVTPNHFEGIRSLFSVNIDYDTENKEILEEEKLITLAKLIEENISSITILSDTIVINIHSVNDTTLNIDLNEEVISKIFKFKPNIKLFLYNREGEVIDTKIFNACTIMDVSSLTYDYTYENNGLKIITAIIKFQ